ncbi:hypothetical protein BC739_004927 [Kutzneria viridogrisea]|uniref:Uncharacterized protein n=1 Tax=Kutzneria viridogrisea TaxID=47990 RepID=A0ABR6BLE1_9PSEU|nr:hypothetical protein [Kutzneria viridogrisea]
MIRLHAEDRSVQLSEQQVSKIKFWLLEFLSTACCRVTAGTGVEITVPDRQVEDLTPALRRRIEEIIGWNLAVAS